MVHKELRLIDGALALIAIYVVGNVVYRTYEAKYAPAKPEQLSLIQRGQQLTDNCTACHYLDQRANFIGPQLVSLIGRPVADDKDYDYSPALKGLKGNWTPERLAAFLSNPQAYAPGTKMPVKGWPAQDVRAIVAYFSNKD